MIAAPRVIRDCGFRFSVMDGWVLGVGLCATGYAWLWIAEFAWLIPFVLLHFLAFCNVFRIQRSLELIWALSFVINAGLWLTDFTPMALLCLFATQLPLTFGLLIIALNRPDYHGIFCHRLNPHLDLHQPTASADRQGERSEGG